MGYLTTFTVYNDGLSQLEASKVEFADGVIGAIRQFRQHPIDVGVGNFANCVRVQPSRHADDHTVYVHCGNCVVEIRHNDTTKELVRRSPQFASTLLRELQRACETLEDLFEELEPSDSRKGRDSNGKETKKEEGAGA